MRIQQIVETTTAGSVATVAQPMMTQTRENTNVRGLKPVQQVMKGAKKKGPYANSIVESKVTEDDLAEQDLIVIPGQGRLRKTGFVKHDLDQGEHEGHTLKNSLHTIARAASELDKRLSVQSEFPEWVSEKIGAAKGMMVTVMDYLISSQEMQHDPDAMAEGKIDFAKKLQKNVDKHNKAVVKTKKDIGSRVVDVGPGGKEHNEKTNAAWDAAKKKVSEGAKVDRMVKHVKQSEKKLGHSDKEAENIAWATANKRGMLDNKNKKK